MKTRIQFQFVAALACLAFWLVGTYPVKAEVWNGDLGSGFSSNGDEAACEITPGDNSAGPGDCGSCAAAGHGMAYWWVSEPQTVLNIEDEPLGYQPARGARVGFRLFYRQRGAAPALSTVFSFGPNWSSTFSSYLVMSGSRLTMQRGGAGLVDYGYVVLATRS